jgi:membrane protease YdiL (CAAX protease family)
MGFGAWYAIVAITGVMLLGVLGVLALLGKLPTRIATPSGRGGVYAETFAFWMLLFLGMNLLLGQVLASVESPAAPFLAALLAMFGSLAALAWPVVRGVPFREVRSDIGLHAGRGPLLETLAGVGGYAIALPLLAAGAIVMLILTRIFEGQGTPSHPAVEGIASAGPLGILAVFLLACVAAPVVEEIMFRGVLYRHLRDATGRAGVALSFAGSALISSVLFAAIHPQGLLFIPILAGLAIGFCITRELRGSLWPCMVAHALTNFVTVTLNVVLASA